MKFSVIVAILLIIGATFSQAAVVTTTVKTISKRQVPIEGTTKSTMREPLIIIIESLLVPIVRPGTVPPTRLPPRV